MAVQVIATYPSQPNGIVGQSYNSLIFVLAGSTSLSSSGSFPSGLRFSAVNGSVYLTGIPTRHGSFTFTTTSNNTTVVGTFTVIVVSGHLFRKSTGHLLKKSANGHLINGMASISSPAITTAALPDAMVGVSYAVQMAATDGTQPYSWSVASGAFPSGLSLSAAGRVAGTPSGTTGSYTVTIRCTDANGYSATRTFVFSLSPSVANVVFTIESGSYYGATNMLLVYDPSGYGYCANDVGNFSDPGYYGYWPYPGQSMPLGGGRVYRHEYPTRPVSANGGYATYWRESATYWDYSVMWTSGASPSGVYRFWVERTWEASGTSSVSYRCRIYVAGALFWERTGSFPGAYSDPRRYTQLWTFNTATGLVT